MDIYNLQLEKVWGKQQQPQAVQDDTSLNSYVKMSSKLGLQFSQVTAISTRISLEKR